MDYLVSVLVLPLLEMFLHDLGVECLEAVWLQLEAIIEFLDILNIVVNCL